MTTKDMSPQRLLSIQEVADLCGVGRSTIQSWRRVGLNGTRLRTFRLGRLCKIREADLETFLDAAPYGAGVCNANEARKESA